MTTKESATKSQLLNDVNFAQEQAISFGQGPLLIIAGAGTGKTTVLTRRIAWLIEQNHAQPEEILALTFTEKAAAEMAERVDQLMPLGYAEINISTFHAFAQKVLQENAIHIGLPGDFKVLTETQSWIMMQKRLNEFELDYYRPMGNPTKFIHSLLKHFQKAKGEGVTPENYLEYAKNVIPTAEVTLKPTKKPRSKKQPKVIQTESEPISHADETEAARLTEIAKAYKQYQTMLLDQNYLDFGDLINYSVKLFKERPAVLKQYQTKFKYVLVDEFQDTDLTQYELVKLVAAPQNNITVVGDDDQSIYKFRGASISNILKFKEDYPQSKEITLTDNYRSTQNILDMAYEFIQLNNPERLETKLKISKKLVSHLEAAGRIEVLHAPTVHQESAMVAETIIAHMEQGESNYNDFAVLVRANDHAEPFISEFTKRGIPYMFVANRGLYKKPFILDLLAYLNLLDNYHETANMFRVLNFKKFQVGAADIIYIAQTAKKKAWSMFEALANLRGSSIISPESHQSIEQLLAMLSKHTETARQTPASEMLINILNDLDLVKQLAQDNAQNSENRNLLEQFYRKIQNFEAENDDKTIRAFLNSVKLEQESGNEGELAFDPNIGPEAVKIMTIHSSKGLEFKTVFIVNMVEARFPSRDRKEQIELPSALVKEILPEGEVHLMEERRLFYVGITRAKQYLYLTWADDYGGSTTKKPSRFLVETGLAQPETKALPTGAVIFAPKPQLPLAHNSPLKIPETFSWTSISSFLKCPLEFKYKYLFHLPSPGSGYTSFGQTIHKAIQLFSVLTAQLNSSDAPDLFGTQIDKNNPQYPPIEKLFEFYDASWIDDWYASKKDKESSKKRGYKLLGNYYIKLTKEKIIPAETEKFFKLKLGNYKYVGVIDCMYFHPDGSVSIIDYKTSAKARKKLEKVEKKQLLAYQWAAQEFFNLKVKNMSYWDLEDLSNVIEFTGTLEELEQIKEEFQSNIEDIVAAIKNNSFYELDRKKAHDCEYIDYEYHTS
jgi:DNA helicase-2/ATP-dependent DNA helicase PcrA